tara:strand:+ start:174 stop:524 length:351 start_codon:yes stop_codon:yes gene_type:complete
MSIVYSYEIKALQIKPSTVNSSGDTISNSIICCWWQRKGIDQNNYVGIYNGSTSLHAHDTSTSDFINFSDVTKDKVISWIKQKLTNEQQINIDKDIQNQINTRCIKEDYSNLPWAS